jgi:hypothetical protein
MTICTSASAGGAGRRPKPFIARVQAWTEKAGGLTTGRRRNARSTFGRGRPAAFLASRSLTDRSRRVVVKARVVRQKAGASAPLSAHLRYLRRDGVSKEGEPARMFGGSGQDSDAHRFAERCEGDRHHFRFIVSPDDALEMTDLRAFTCDLLAEIERDPPHQLDWTAVDHWNTEHPHVHIIVRGYGDDDGDLVISRDYISHGLRARAEHMVTLEFGARSDLELAENSTHKSTRTVSEARPLPPLLLARTVADRTGLLHFRIYYRSLPALRKVELVYMLLRVQQEGETPVDDSNHEFPHFGIPDST